MRAVSSRHPRHLTPTLFSFSYSQFLKIGSAATVTFLRRKLDIGIYFVAPFGVRAMGFPGRVSPGLVNKTSVQRDQAEDEHALAMSRACRVF
jgi:hypothetical protein